MTDGLATREYFLEKSGQMVPPLKSEGFFILCCGWELRKQPGSYCGNGSHPSPSRGEPSSQHQYPELISLGLIWGSSQWQQNNSVQCLCCEPCSLGKVSFYILGSTLLDIVALVPIIQLQHQRHGHFILFYYIYLF